MCLYVSVCRHSILWNPQTTEQILKTIAGMYHHKFIEGILPWYRMARRDNPKCWIPFSSWAVNGAHQRWWRSWMNATRNLSNCRRWSPTSREPFLGKLDQCSSIIQGCACIDTVTDMRTKNHVGFQSFGMYKLRSTPWVAYCNMSCNRYKSSVVSIPTIHLFQQKNNRGQSAHSVVSSCPGVVWSRTSSASLISIHFGYIVRTTLNTSYIICVLRGAFWTQCLLVARWSKDRYIYFFPRACLIFSTGAVSSPIILSRIHHGPVGWSV